MDMQLIGLIDAVRAGNYVDLPPWTQQLVTAYHGNLYHPDGATLVIVIIIKREEAIILCFLY